MTDLISRPFAPDPTQCCERCVFGRGRHAEWCFALTDEMVETLGVLPGFVRTGRDAKLRATFYRAENA